MYDIVSNSMRSKVAKRLLAAGYDRIQLSIFLGLSDPQKNTILWGELEEWFANDINSKLFVLPLTKNNFKKMLILGHFKPDIDYYIGDRHTLFI